MRKKVAIIGGGIAGIASAYYLGDKFDITIFEKNTSLGGNIDTHLVKEKNGNTIPIDTGFISFNKEKYPRFIDFLEKLNVPYEKSITSFGLVDKNKKISYSGENYFYGFLKTLSVFSKNYWIFLYDGLRFSVLAKNSFSKKPSELSIINFCERYNFSKIFIHDYLLPVISGLFSRSINEAKKIPAYRVLNYFINHGLVDILNSTDCLYVKNGYKTYIEAVTKRKNITVKVSSEVKKVKKIKDGVELEIAKKNYFFNAVILASEADIAFKILDNPSAIQKHILSLFNYKVNKGYLHTDESIMSDNKSKWATTTAQINKDDENNCYSIWLNNILCLNSEQDYFMTLNSWQKISPEKIIKTISYRHLILDKKTIEAQKELNKINDHEDLIYFAGSYWNYFHEDAMYSAYISAQKIINIFK